MVKDLEKQLFTTITEGNRIRIPKQIMVQMGWTNGMFVLLEIEDGAIKVIPAEVVPRG